jgi:hypothetical protein
MERRERKLELQTWGRKRNRGSSPLLFLDVNRRRGQRWFLMGEKIKERQGCFYCHQRCNRNIKREVHAGLLRGGE